MKTQIKIPNTAAHASYAGGVLTLDLPRAMQPTLWRQEIKNISNVVFWVTHDGGVHALMMRLSGGIEQIIARFADEIAAQQALAAIREIFINGNPRKSFWSKLIKIIFWLLVIWVVGTFVIQLIAGLLIPKKYLTEPAPATVTSTPAPVAPAPMSPATIAPPANLTTPAAPPAPAEPQPPVVPPGADNPPPGNNVGN